LKRIGAKLTDKPGLGDITVFYGQPGLEPHLRKLWRVRTRAKFLWYSMFECSVPPPGWVDVIEGRLPGVDPADGLCVPSTWVGEMFRENGITKPIHVIPHGVDGAEFPYIERDADRPFTFLWQGVSPNDRKGGWLVREAFEELDFPDAWLVLKWWNGRGFYWRDRDKRIEHIGQKLTDADMLKLFRRCDCSVNPTSGEGFGLIPLEHAATGMATVVTGWSGPADYVRDTHMWELDYRLGHSVFGHGAGIEDAVDAKPDMNSLREAMGWLYENPDKAIAIGKKSSKRIHKVWTWENAARKLIDAVSEHVPRETVMEGSCL